MEYEHPLYLMRFSSVLARSYDHFMHWCAIVQGPNVKYLSREVTYRYKWKRPPTALSHDLHPTACPTSVQPLPPPQ